MPLVSVIMPVRNAEPYVASAVSSVLEQTLTDLELIVVDDGCTDSSMDSVRSVADNRVSIVEGRGEGPGAARNDAIARSSAPWIAFMDADDLSAPTRLSEQLSALTKDDKTFSAVGCSYRAIDETGNTIVDVPHLQHPEAIAAAAYSFMPVCGSTLMIGRTEFDSVGGYTEDSRFIGIEDYELVCALLRTGARIKNLGAFLYLYRWHPVSTSRTRRDVVAAATSAVRRRHWELAPPGFSIRQIRESRVGRDRLHASAFTQLAIGCGRHGLWPSAAKIALATAVYNPRGVLEITAGHVSAASGAARRFHPGSLRT